MRRFESRAWALLAVLGMVLGLAPGCGPKSRRTIVPAVPEDGDPDARARFQHARQTFEKDGKQSGTTTEFEQIAEAYPDDPVAPYALLYAGIAAIKSRDYFRAVASLRKLEQETGVDEGLRKRGRLFLGIALNYQGEHAKSVAHLRAGEQAIENDDERGEWLAAMAEAIGSGSRPLDALGYYDRWHDKATAAEQAYVIARMQALVSDAQPIEVRQAYQALDNRSGPAAAILGIRLAADYTAAGDTTRAGQIRAETAAARKKHGFSTPVRSGVGNERLIGAVLPLTGRRGRLGDLVVRGAALAAGSFEAEATDFEILVRDSGSTSTRAAAGVDALADDGVIAVVGPISNASVAASSGRAAVAGLPHVSLDPRPQVGGRQGAAFHVFHSAEARARQLARYAYGKGIRDFAVLAPDSGYGRAVGGAFRSEVAKLGGSIVVSHTYKANETSFTKVVKQIRKPWEAVFVAEQASRLALIAPALAATNMVSTPIGGKKPRHGRKIVLLSTAEGLQPSYLRNAGRYSRGAILAPGFYPDRFDRRIGDFVDRYELAFGRLPTSWEAHAHDAVAAVASAVRSGATSRRALADALLRVKVKGLTGTVDFGADGLRTDNGLLFTVGSRSGVQGLVIRALRD